MTRTGTFAKFILCILLCIAVLASCTPAAEKNAYDSGKTDQNTNTSNAASNLSEAHDDTTLSSDATLEKNISLYYINAETRQIESEARRFTLPYNTSIYSYVIEQLLMGPQTEALQSVIAPGTRLIGTAYSDEVLYVNLSVEFYESSNKLLAQITILKSLYDNENVSYIELQVEGVPVDYQSGNVYGLLYKPGEYALLREQNTQFSNEPEPSKDKQNNCILYFTDAGCIYRIPEVRTIRSSLEALPRYVAEEFVKGPQTNDALISPLPKGTGLMGYSFQDGVVSLTFSEEFKATATEWFAYGDAIMNTLIASICSLPNVYSLRVSYMENGEETRSVLGTWDLQEYFTLSDLTLPLGRSYVLYLPDDSNPDKLVRQRGAMYAASDETQHNVLYEGVLANLPEQLISQDINRQPVDHMYVDSNLRIAYVSINYNFALKLTANPNCMLYLYCLTNTITAPENHLNADRVQILIEGKKRETVNNVYLSSPITPNFTIVRDEIKR